MVWMGLRELPQKSGKGGQILIKDHHWGGPLYLRIVRRKMNPGSRPNQICGENIINGREWSYWLRASVKNHNFWFKEFTLGPSVSHSLAEVGNSQILMAFIHYLVVKWSSIVKLEGYCRDKLVIACNNLLLPFDSIRRWLAKIKWGYFICRINIVSS